MPLLHSASNDWRTHTVPSGKWLGNSRLRRKCNDTSLPQGRPTFFVGGVGGCTQTIQKSLQDFAWIRNKLEINYLAFLKDVTSGLKALNGANAFVLWTWLPFCSIASESQYCPHFLLYAYFGVLYVPYSVYCLYAKSKWTVILLMYLYCIVVSNMFRPFMWPSLGWFVWEQEYSCK